MSVQSFPERIEASKSLVSFLMAIEGIQATFELHNDITATGTIEMVDSKMNINIKNARVWRFPRKKSPKRTLQLANDELIGTFESFFLKGTSIHAIHIDQDLSPHPLQLTQQKVKSLLTRGGGPKRKIMKKRLIKYESEKALVQKYKSAKAQKFSS